MRLYQRTLGFGALAIALCSAPALAQSSSASLPAPTVVRVPATFGAASGGGAPPNSPENMSFRPGEFISRPVSAAERPMIVQQMQAQRAAEAQQYLQKYGAGQTVKLKHAKY